MTAVPLLRPSTVALSVTVAPEARRVVSRSSQPAPLSVVTCQPSMPASAGSDHVSVTSPSPASGVTEGALAGRTAILSVSEGLSASADPEAVAV